VQRQRVDIERDGRLVVQSVAVREPAMVDSVAHVSEGALVAIEGDADAREAQEDVNDNDRGPGSHDAPIQSAWIFGGGDSLAASCPSAA